MMRAVGAGLGAIRRAALVRVAGRNVARMARSGGDGVQVTVYLGDGLSPARAKKIADAVARLPGVGTVHAVDSHEAYERLRTSLGERAGLLDGVEEGLL